MKHIVKWLLIVVLVIGLAPKKAEAVLELDKPIVVYGANLSASQKDEVKRLLEVDSEIMTEYEVDGQDIAHYINGDPNSNMYSSVKITPKEEGYGISVNIITSNNITKVTSEMYKNALLTAGVENANVEVGSPIPVTGGSALSGIYKAYDVSGAELDKGRMEVANDELNVTTELAEKEGMTDEKVTELMTEIKKTIAEKKPATREDVEEIVTEQLQKLEINLSEQDRQLLIDLFEKMRDLNIDFGKVKEQLEDIRSTIKDKLGDIDLDLDEGFWQKVKDFFNRMIDKIAGLFG